jgi:succinate-acetate transporter protein
MVTFLKLCAMLFFVLALGSCVWGNQIQAASGSVLLLIALVSMIGAYVIELLQDLRKQLLQPDRQPPQN